MSINLNDYSHTQVPTDKKVPSIQIAMAIAAVGLSLPSFVLGGQMAQSLGLLNAILAFFTAGIVLSVLGSFSAYIAGELNRPTFFIIKKAFGKYGSKIINLILAIASFGWFGITIGFTVKALHTIVPLPFYSEIIWTLISGVLMTLTAIFGFKGLMRLTSVAVPLLTLSLVYLAIEGFNGHGLTNINNLIPLNDKSFKEVVSILVGSWIVGATVFPDYSRFAKNKKAAIRSSFLSFTLCFALILTLSALVTSLFNNLDVQGLLALVFPISIAAGIIILASWSSNDSNLYSTSLALAGVFNTKKYKLCIIGGTFGTVLALFDILGNFITALILMGLFMPPILGAYVADYFTDKDKYFTPENDIKNISIKTTLGFILGVGTALVTNYTSFYITTMPVFDGLIVSFITVYCLNKYIK